MKLIFKKGKYDNENVALLAVDAETGEPYANATVNIKKLPKRLAALDTNNWPDVVEVLMKERIITSEKLGYLQSGFYEYPIYQLNLKGLQLAE
jgi:hypothetical protein